MAYLALRYGIVFRWLGDMPFRRTAAPCRLRIRTRQPRALRRLATIRALYYLIYRTLHRLRYATGADFT